MSRRNSKLKPHAISKIFVENSRYKKIEMHMDELIDEGYEKDNCKGLMIRGRSGVGKTFCVKIYIERWLKKNPSKSLLPGILYVETPANCTTRNFTSVLLAALRTPDPDHGDESETSRRIVAEFERHDVSLLVIDEIHRLIDKDTDKIKRKTSVWLASQLNHIDCPILVIGELETERLYYLNDYLERRTEGECLIEPYDWADEDDRYEFAAICQALGNNIGLPLDSNLGSLSTAFLICEFANGSIGFAANLINKARVIARRHGRPKITHDLLEMAVDELRIGQAKRLKNPFREARLKGEK